MSTSAPPHPALLEGGQPLSTWQFLRWLATGPSWGRLVLLVGTLAMLWGGLALFYPQTGGQDLYWYLSAGKLIATSGQLGGPHADPFAYTTQAPFEAPRWLNHEWLFTWLIYVVHQQAGIAGLVALKFGLLALWTGAFALLGHRLCRDWVLGLLTAAYTIPLLGDFCDLRPQLLTYLCTTLLFACWLRPPARPWPMLGRWLALLVLWANCHSAVIFGVAFLVGALVLHGLSGKLSWHFVIPALVLVLAVPLLNPFGLEVYTYPLSWIGNDALKEVIQEWHSVTDGSKLSTVELLWILLPTFTVMLLLRAQGGRAALAWDPMYLLLIGVYLMPLQASRHLPLAHIAIAAWWMLAIASCTPWLRQVEHEDTLPRTVPGARTYVEVLAVLLLFASMPVGSWTSLPESWPKRTIEQLHPPYQFPTGAWAFIDRYDLQGNILNFYDWGGWLTWQLAQESPQVHHIAIDGRLNTVYAFDTIAAYGSLVTAQPASLTQRPGWDLIGSPADLALLPTLLSGQTVDITQQFATHPDWALVYEDPVASVFVRRSRVTSEFIEQAQSLHLPVPDDPMAHYGRGMQVLRFGDVAGATREFEACLALDPQHEDAREQLALLATLNSMQP